MFSLIGIVAICVFIGGGFIVAGIISAQEVGSGIRLALGIGLSLLMAGAFVFLALGTKFDELEDLIKGRAAVYALYGIMAIAAVHGVLDLVGIVLPPIGGIWWFGLVMVLWNASTFLVSRKYR